MLPRCSDPRQQETAGSLIAQTPEYREVGSVCSQAMSMSMSPPLGQFVGDTIIYCVRREGNYKADRGGPRCSDLSSLMSLPNLLSSSSDSPPSLRTIPKSKFGPSAQGNNISNWHFHSYLTAHPPSSLSLCTSPGPIEQVCLCSSP